MPVAQWKTYIQVKLVEIVMVPENLGNNARKQKTLEMMKLLIVKSLVSSQGYYFSCLFIIQHLSFIVILLTSICCTYCKFITFLPMVQINNKNHKYKIGRNAQRRHIHKSVDGTHLTS